MTPQQRYYRKNKERLLKESRERYHKNIEAEKRRAKRYHELNRNVIKKNRRLRTKQKRIQDPSFKLKSNISRRIRYVLKKNGSSKSGQSILQYLQYSIQDLKNHLEIQFESWMNWNNYGVYNVNVWKDNDTSTWTWQLDHIIPQVNLPYVSMEDDKFKKCWSLSNLRPLSSKENFIKGSRL